MRLFIAEKPSMGKEIAKNLGGKMVNQGPAGKPPTHIEVGGDVVTWCFGHLLEMAPPEHYSEAFKKWSFDTLPIEPKEFELLPKDSAKGQISAIKALLKKATTVVNAGDPDREGQLLVDELLDHLGNTKPVQRIILQALDEASVKKALANIQPNSLPQFVGWKNSAMGRQRSDWFWGMNLTRAHTPLANVKARWCQLDEFKHQHSDWWLRVICLSKISDPKTFTAFKPQSTVQHLFLLRNGSRQIQCL